MRSLIAMATASAFALVCVQTAQAGGWGEVVKTVVRVVARGAARGMTTRTVVVTAERRAAIAAQSAKIAEVRSTIVVTSHRARIGDAIFLLSNIVTFMSVLGIQSSESEEVDAMFHKDVAAAAAAKERAYIVLVCKRPDGVVYGVPSDATACLHGGVPETLDRPVDLAAPKLNE